MIKPSAIRVSGVSKDFLLPHERVTSVKGALTGSLWSRGQKTKDVQHALRDISLDIREGDFFGIVGRNGSGKSTLLKILAGIYQPTKGTVQSRGKLVPFIELGVGFNPELTGRENVYLNGAMLGFSRKETEGMYQEIVDFAELGDFMDQKLKNYSSGMQVRLAFSMATRSRADILLIDEVLAVGDAHFQRKCYQFFRSLKRKGVTVVFVSHDMEAVREYCTRCALIDDSRVIYDGEPEVAAEKYIKLFNTLSDDKKTKQEENDDRWGDGIAKVDSINVETEGGTVRIKASIRFFGGLEHPIIGFNIKNSSGQILCGSNSRILKQKTGSYKKGDALDVEWVVPNIFGDDELGVETAITHSDGVTQSDWWHNAASFTNTNPESTPHPVSPEVQMSVTRQP